MGIVLLVLAIGLIIFSIFVALGTYVVKRVYFRSKTQRHKADDSAYCGNPKEGTKWYPTGWTYNTKTGKWEPPNYLQDQSKEKWEWNEDKQIWINKEKEARLEKYRKYHEGRPPTFEEWKAAREQENSNN